MNVLSAWSIPIGLAVLANFAFWGWLGRPVDLPPAPEAKLHCASYTPFRGAQTPFDRSLVIPAVQIEADLLKLKPVTDCVRTYAVDQGLDQVVPIAEEFGMKVLLGIWIGREAASNERQIATAIQLAKEHPATIKAIIVGNEVLLRGEQTGETLAELVTRVKQATGLPVTYADVWEFWLRAPQALKDAVDVVTIHILPYWEDDPIPADHGVAHLAAIVDIVRNALPGKRIMVGETGWPSAGRPREDAVPSIVNQARYLREFLVYAKTQDLDYNFIEAFDQPWKRWQEGAAGGYWGLFKEDRNAKFDWFKPVSEYPNFVGYWLKSSVDSLIILSAGALLGGNPGIVYRLTLAFLAVFVGSVLELHQLRMPFVVRNGWEAALETGLAIQVFFAGQLLLLSAARGTAGECPASVASSLGWLLQPWSLPKPGIVLGVLRLTSTLGAATASLGLCFDSRYRDFPLAAFAVPAIGFFLLALWRGEILPRREDQREEAALSLILAGTAVFIAVNEGPLNLHALAWCALTLLLAAPGIGALRGLRKARMQVGSSLTA